MRCKEEIWDSGAYHPRQCRSKAITDGWCGLHHPEAKERRRKARNDRVTTQLLLGRCEEDLRHAEAELLAHAVRCGVGNYAEVLLLRTKRLNLMEKLA